MQRPLSKARFAINVALPIIALVFIALRFIARRRQNAPLRGDDWTIVAAMIFSLGPTAAGLYTSINDWWGLSNDAVMASSEICVPFLKLLVVSTFMSHVPWAFTKISALLFFKRIFVTRRFSMAANVLIGLVVAWFVAFITAGLCSYRPFSAFWSGCTAPAGEKTQPVINLEMWMLSDVIFDLILEVAILILPIPMIVPLRLKKSRKLAILTVFSLGASCCVATCFRIAWIARYFHWERYDAQQRADITAHSEIWGNIESYASIIAVCLPTLGSLISMTLPHISRRMGNSEASNYALDGVTATSMHQTNTPISPSWPSRGIFGSSDIDIYNDLMEEDAKRTGSVAGLYHTLPHPAVTRSMSTMRQDSIEDGLYERYGR